MSISTMLDGTWPRASFELFPPRGKSSAIWARLEALYALSPDFLSVTYGASGTGHAGREASLEVLRYTKEHTSIPVLAHLTCTGVTRLQLVEVIEEMLEIGVRDFLALRGDPPKGKAYWKVVPGGIASSIDLIDVIRAVADAHGVEVDIAVAAYPTSEMEARNRDIAALQSKEHHGATFAITQLFFDAKEYAEHVMAMQEAGVTIPLVPGVLPLTDPSRLLRMSQLSGRPVPASLLKLLEINDPAERVRRGLRATDQLICDILDAGAPGIHLYTFNRTRPARDIVERLRAQNFRTADTGSIDVSFIEQALYNPSPGG
ncbi:MAG: methylenetetrahydrofolate reductase [Actinomycetaceae bacterium]|nr:methylenetetrahydrofolate reductase [Actinomycetaceae bacterium]